MSLLLPIPARKKPLETLIDRVPRSYSLPIYSYYTSPNIIGTMVISHAIDQLICLYILLNSVTYMAVGVDVNIQYMLSLISIYP